MSIDIAIIDSGINPAHPHVQWVAGGICFDLDTRGKIITTDCIEDRIGHGTAIAGIFRQALPTARIWAVKVFQDDLTVSSRVLIAGMDWAIKADMKIIHLSLGTEREADRRSIEKLCQKAHQKGLFVSAAARECNDTVYPARLDTVIATYWDRACKPGAIPYHPNQPIEFGAWGHPRPIPGLDQRHNFCGSSFAAAHVSAMIAQTLASNNSADWAVVKQVLIRKAITHSCSAGLFSKVL
jgi:subtilisin family serine protease